MAFLAECSELWGKCRIVNDDPHVDIVRAGFYVPCLLGTNWGIYDDEGKLVSSATDFREERQPSHNQILSNINLKNFIDFSTRNEVVIYGGYINVHYGHFLINSLPRLWALTKLKTPSTKILCHCTVQPVEWFKYPFIATIMEALGLNSDDFVTPDIATRYNSIVIPDTSLREQSTGHHVYGTFCRAIAERIIVTRRLRRQGSIAYFSKSRLKSAVGLIENEFEIEKALNSHGVDIFYPVLMPLADQIAIFDNYDRVLGTSGSFLHTSIFSEGSTIFCLNVTSQINTNYLIIDRLSKNKSSYFYPFNIQVNDSRPGVLTSRTLPEARLVAEELLQIAMK